jgi:AraC-like DNA-binding protein
MPIYMDRHDVSEEVTAAHVAQLHQEDLKIEHLFNCKGLTYWFDAKRKTAFCLMHAPNREAIEKMHDTAHGNIPHSIIEVDETIVESFLGRIEDPKKSLNAELNIINDPAFRTIMVIGIKRLSFKNSTTRQLDLVICDYIASIAKALKKFKGSIVKQKSGYFLTSFDSVTNAVLCALEIQVTLGKAISDHVIELNVGISAGIPVTDKDGIFEDTIKSAERLCDVVIGQIVISSEVQDLYESENSNISIDKELVHTLDPSDEKFVNMLMDFTEREWCNTNINAEGFSKSLGYSKSQLYRKMVSVTGKSPNNFIMEYRLNRALKLLNKVDENISQIAFETGFNSPEYFSKCFCKKFGVLPSAYLKQG